MMRPPGPDPRRLADDPGPTLADGAPLDQDPAGPDPARGGPWQAPGDPLLGALVRRRYRVVAARAHGGLATVYRALDERKGEPVALKVLHASWASLPATRERFRREVELSIRLGARVGAAGRASGALDGRPFLVLDYLEGPTVRERLVAGGAAPLAEAVATTLRLLARVAVLHDEGLLHGDLKPANVLLRTGALLDLGSAAPLGEAAEGPARSPAYGAPELWREGTRADPRADLFSVGAILFELVTGRRALTIDPAAPLSAMAAPGSRALPPLPPAAAALEPVLRRALASDPAARFPSARAMGAALEAVHPAGRTEEAP